MTYLSFACVFAGLGVIYHGAFRKDFDWPPVLREQCPIWWYRLCVIAVGVGLVAIGILRMLL